MDEEKIMKEFELLKQENESLKQAQAQAEQNRLQLIEQNRIAVKEANDAIERNKQIDLKLLAIDRKFERFIAEAAQQNKIKSDVWK